MDAAQDCDVLVVYGTRPEAIKLGPVIRQLMAHPTLRTSVWLTGQHASMLDQVNDIFGVVPDGNLGVLKTGQGLNANLAEIIAGIDEVLSQVSPRAILVQGDTTTVLGAAIAAFQRGIAVVHLEAGLRTDDLRNPFPEEANRRLVSQVTALHLAPTIAACANLEREGVPRSAIALVGNTAVDAVEWVLRTRREADQQVMEWLAGRSYAVITTHRRESWDTGIARVADAIRILADRHPELGFVIPMHKNPIVRDRLVTRLAAPSNVLLVEPMGYAAFTTLMAGAVCVLTDSGGIQEEAPTLGVPVLILRDVTERPEAVECGACRLVGTDTDNVVNAFELILNEQRAGTWKTPSGSPFGDGRAAEHSVAAIHAFLESGLVPTLAVTHEGGTA